MAGVLQHLRSSTLDKRPNPASMVDGQVAVNYASGSPGMFFKDSNGDLVKVGPVHVGATAPNVSPASGGTAGNSKGEQWLDTSGGTYVFKIWDGGAWRSEAGEFVNTTGDTMTGSLTMGASADIIFEGSVDDGFETTLTVVNPTADRTIALPNVTGTVVTTGDSGTVTSTMIANGAIVDANVNASAAIAGTKIAPNFGSQTVQTTGIFSAASGSASTPSIAFTGDTNTGIYSPGADQVAISTNGTGRLFVSSAGRLGLGTTASISASAPLDDFHIASTDPAVLLEETDAGTDEKLWRIRAEGSILRFEGVNDAFNSTTAWMNVTRTTGARTVDNIAFTTGGTNERLRIDSSGRLGLGTSSPDATLNVRAGANNTTAQEIASFSRPDATVRAAISKGLISGTANGIAIGTTTNHPFALNTNGAERLYITNTGNVGVGTTSPSRDLEIASTAPTIRLTDTDGTSQYSEILTSGSSLIIQSRDDASNGNIIFRGLGGGVSSEYFRCDASGRLLVGTSTNSGGALLQVNGDRIRVGTAKTPASATDTGTAGEICWDANYIYVCTATNTWKRTAIATW